MVSKRILTVSRNEVLDQDKDEKEIALATSMLYYPM